MPISHAENTQDVPKLAYNILSEKTTIKKRKGLYEDERKTMKKST